MSTSATSFGGKTVPSKVVSELNARNKITALNKWFASRSVWVEVVSMSQGCSTYSRMSGFAKPAYESGQYDGARPHPVITNVRVTSTGNLGTMREVAISMIAFTPEQLNELEKCFFIPYMSVRVLFGWSVSADQTIQASVETLGDTLTDNQAICKIKNMAPIADGVQGRVAKYDISFDKDNLWWNINLKLVAASNAVLALPVEDFTSTCDCETVAAPNNGESDGEKKDVTASAFKQVFINLAEYAQRGDKTAIKEYAKQLDLNGGTYCAKLYNKNRWKNTFMEKLAGFVPGGDFIAKNVFGGFTSIESYISIDALISALQTRSMSRDPKTNKPIYGEFNNTRGGAISLPPKGLLQSSDPHKALFPLEQYEELTAPSCLTADKKKCYVGNILVNVIYAYRCLEDCGKNATIEDFMTRILQGVNEASGNLWELSIIDTGEGCDKPEFSIIDLQQVEKEASILSIDASPTSAVLRGVDLKLELTDAMQTQALYGGVRNQKTDQSCDQTRFAQIQKTYINKADPIKTDPPQKPDCNKNASIGCKDTPTPPPGNPLQLFKKSLEKLRKDTETPELKEACYAEQVKMNNYKEAQSDRPEQCNASILPYSFNFSVDGIGGFSFGQIVTSNVLPENMRKVFKYQIVSVEHDVSHNDWITSIRTKPRYK